MSDSGFRIDNLDNFDELLRNAQKEIPNMLRRTLETLGEELLNSAKDAVEPIVDLGTLRNSLQRGGKGGIWKYKGSAGAASLAIGSTVKHAIYIHEGYTIKKDHWVPGIIDSSGKFRYQSGAKTGIMAKARTFKGIPFFEVAMKDIQAIAPRVIQYEFEKLFRGM